MDQGSQPKRSWQLVGHLDEAGDGRTSAEGCDGEPLPHDKKRLS